MAKKQTTETPVPAEVKEPKKVKKTVAVSAEKPTPVTTKETKKATKKPKKGSEITEFFVTASKQDIITKFGQKDGDTGSPEVQVALASHKITHLALHLELNPKDNHSRRGLLKIISKRRRILNYLASQDEARYQTLIKSLQLKK